MTESPTVQFCQSGVGVGASSMLTSADEVRRGVLAGLSKPPNFGPLYSS
jgi:hypothetical protein